MSSSRRDFKFWWNAWLPVVICVIVIALESCKYFGADHTSGPLRWVWEHLFGHVGNAEWAKIHHMIRKTGHFFGYGTVGLMWLRAWWKTLPHCGYFLDAFLALLGTAAVASCDEWHQSYIPNRTGSPWDVLLDCCGVITLELLVYVYLRLYQSKRPAAME